MGQILAAAQVASYLASVTILNARATARSAPGYKEYRYTLNQTMASRYSQAPSAVRRSLFGWKSIYSRTVMSFARSKKPLIGVLTCASCSYHIHLAVEPLLQKLSTRWQPLVSSPTYKLRLSLDPRKGHTHCVKSVSPKFSSRMPYSAAICKSSRLMCL